MCWSESGLGLDWDQTIKDHPWQSWSQSQKFHRGPDHPVSGLAKMAPDWTRLNFPNTSLKVFKTLVVCDYDKLAS